MAKKFKKIIKSAVSLGITGFIALLIFGDFGF